MGIISWIIFGLIIGAIARLLRPSVPGGWIASIIIGIVGAWVGSFVFEHILGPAWAAGWSFKGIISAVVGAIIVVAIYHAIVSKKS